MAAKAIALLVAAAIGPAADRGTPIANEARAVSTEWLVTPLEPGSVEHIVRPHEIVFRQRVLPIGYLRTDGDAIDAKNGKVAIPAGTDFYRLRTASGVVACAMRTQKPNALESVFGVGKVRYCLIDRESRGSFDAIVAYVTNIKGLPAANGRLPKTPRLLARPVAYQVRDPREAPDDLFVGIEYEGKFSLGSTPHFETVFGRGTEVGKLNQAWRADTRWDKATRTGRITLDGARLEVTGLDNGDVRIRIVQTLPARPMVLGTLQGDYFY